MPLGAGKKHQEHDEYQQETYQNTYPVDKLGTEVVRLVEHKLEQSCYFQLD